MNNKKSYIATFIIILIISGFLIWLGCNNNDNPLFQYNLIEQVCKPSRETSLVFTKLEEAQFWAIKGISREVE